MHLRTVSSVILATLAIAASLAPADTPKRRRSKAKVTTKAEPPPGKGFWKILVQPNAKWTLSLLSEAESTRTADYYPNAITIETYDVHKVGDADVARLRWRRVADSTESALAGTHAPPLDHFAVSSAGLYILPADFDDAHIAEVIKGKPSQSDPPTAYKGTKLNDGRYLEIRDGLVCIGQGPTPGSAECEDTCGDICISATDGIVRLEGSWAPNMFDFIQVKAKAKAKK